MKSIELVNGTTKILTLTESEARDGVFLCFEPGYASGKVSIEVIADSPASKPRGTRIKGHPNCHMGDCNECHVVSCGIYQGYDTAEPEDEEDEVPATPAQPAEPPKKKVTVKGHPNCEWGECNDCHVVSCPIYLEYEVAEPDYD